MAIRVESLAIRNVRGIEALSVEKIGTLTIFEGANGLGKTSGLDAVRCALEGPSGNNVLRLGAEQAEIILRLSNGWKIVRKVGANAGVTITDEDDVELSKPMARLKQLFDALSFDPVKFVHATGKERLDAVLTLVNDDSAEGEIAHLAESKGVEVPPRHRGEGIGDYLDRARKSIFDARREVNRAKKDAQGGVKRLESSVPDAGENPEAEYEATQTATGELEARYQSAKEELYEKQQAELKALTTKHAKQKESLAKKGEAKLRDSRQARDDAHTAWMAYQRSIGLREQLEREQERLTKLDGRSTSHTEALQAIDAKKTELIGSIGIDGLDWNDEAADLTVDGLPFGDRSQSERIVTALNVCLRRATQDGLRVICVDGLESLDTQARAALESYATKEHVQIIGARVTDADELEIVGDVA